MNPDLYERYLQKKAKKLGITVEELKAQNSTGISSQKEESKPQYVQQTIQDQLKTTIQPETVKTEVPSYIFGPSKMDETRHSHSELNLESMLFFGL